MEKNDLDIYRPLIQRLKEAFGERLRTVVLFGSRARGKTVLMLFGVSTKTHEPAKHLAQLIKLSEIHEAIRDCIKDILPDFLSLGAEEHFMTDYGDEASYKLPWELFDEESAQGALRAAQKCYAAAAEIVKREQDGP
jgi:hypothetical protein